MKFERAGGILLHPTSLPGPFGIGDLGPAAYRWIDFLDETGCALWQVLPLGPTGYGDSPYQCFSAFAGNPLLISPELLITDGLLTPDDLREIPDFPPGRVDYGVVIPWKLSLLDRAFARFKADSRQDLMDEFSEFCARNKFWLGDFSLFMALKDAHGGGAWIHWPVELRRRDADALQQARRELAVSIEKHIFRQFLFFRQWSALRRYAHRHSIRIIGDIPIFVAHDSAEVWARPELFYLDESGNPIVVAGVPPDYFSETGQLWGNPLYRWEVHRKEGYAWWFARIRTVLSLVDIVRLDHFRGFAGYWEVPFGEETAVKGRWVKGPGLDFFQKLAEDLGDLPIIAEDLGVITRDVAEMRDHFGLPGMRIIQFAFHGDPTEPFLPHNHVENCVVYTGTHDNDTSLGWYRRVPEEERDFFRRYLNRDGSQVSWDFIRAAWGSVAVFALAPLQDFLELGNEARMNYPGNPGGNWAWRMPQGCLTDHLGERIREINFLYARDKRHPSQPPEPEEMTYESPLE